jgi:hypothetical protein
LLRRGLDIFGSSLVDCSVRLTAPAIAHSSYSGARFPRTDIADPIYSDAHPRRTDAPDGKYDDWILLSGRDSSSLSSVLSTRLRIKEGGDRVWSGPRGQRPTSLIGLCSIKKRRVAEDYDPRGWLYIGTADHTLGEQKFKVRHQLSSGDRSPDRKIRHISSRLHISTSSA